MPASLATVNQITKEIYQGKIQDQLQDEAVAWKRIEQTSAGVESQVGGKYVTFPLRVRRNHGIGYRNEQEQLQQAGQQGYRSVRLGLKYGYGRVHMTGQLMELADKNYQAFASAMDREMTGLKNDIAKDTNRIFYGSGNGALATVSAAAGNDLTVVSAQRLEIGMQVDVVAAADGTVSAADRQITAINGTTVTVSGAAVVLGGGTQILTRQGNYGREPNGLENLVSDTGVVHELDPAVEPTWKARVNSNGGTLRALSEGLLIAETDQVRVNGGKTSLILVSLGVRRAYFNLLSQQRRYPNTTEFAGGFKGLAFNNGREIPVIEDPDAPANTIYGLDEDSFKIYRDEPWSWLDKDGSIWKWVNNYDAYEAVMRQYWEVGVSRRNANFVIRDVAEG